MKQKIKAFIKDDEHKPTVYRYLLPSLPKYDINSKTTDFILNLQAAVFESY